MWESAPSELKKASLREPDFPGVGLRFVEEIALSHSAKLIYFILESGIYLRPSAFAASSVGPEKPFARSYEFHSVLLLS